ncbi:TIGR04283 family arsenosugar biosynthesis glycosyltransferase [Gracilimonas mengyeensis]|uniref:Transferase 2, rSAM/selenodomain-associated n=1 Tax=Gracilimonas mengyeensis TaxID=1302730 RepID=A0A521EJ38_9BACT|nr:TIGR04283 family arsenosugar biosynthesis glycosyltransferase [Gracilimonas mengyeensis]SMO83957.1 transferase 2, rSAM/selenodomain-associated [Gracilimonas mengyeensis]
MLSIIIPAYNEADSIGKLVRCLQQNRGDYKTEILVIDGGSTDETRQVAEKAGAFVYTSPQKGRAPQMNYGAKMASGEVLYFLHADTYPPENFGAVIKRMLNEGAAAGCFRLKFDWDHPALKFYSWFTRFDLDVFRFGDQSLFAEKELFERAGGFREDLLVMEDQEIVTRLKKYAQFSIAEEAVVTSTRKYRQFGVFQLQCIFSIIVFLYYLRISQEVIKHFYENFLSGAPY